MRVPSIEGLVYFQYEVLIGKQWRALNLCKPLLPQVKGMRAYRLLNANNKIVKHSDVKPEA